MSATAPDKRKKPPKKISADYLHNAGLAYLQRFPASTAQFRRVMMRKIDRSCRFHADQNRDDCVVKLDALIEKFHGMGLLNDEAYSRGMVTSLRRRGASAAAIKSKLSAKGLPGDDINRALNDYAEQGGADELTAALIHARKKKIGPFRPPSKEANRDKELAALARAGFGYGMAEKVLDMDSGDAEDFLHAIT